MINLKASTKFCRKCFRRIRTWHQQLEQLFITFLGAPHTLLLQRKVAYVSNITNNLAETKADLKIVIKAIQRQEFERANLAQPQQFPPAQNSVSASESEAGPDSEKVLDSEHHTLKSGRSDETGAEGFFSHAKNILITGGTFNNIVDSIKELDDLEERAINVRNILNGMDSYHQDLAPPHLIDKIHELLGKVLATKKGANMISRQDTLLTIGQVKPAVRFMVTYGNIPSISMAAGVACLALSTILVAAGLQSVVLGPEVWITCLLTVVGIVTLSFLPARSAFILSLVFVMIDIYCCVQLLRLEAVGNQV